MIFSPPRFYTPEAIASADLTEGMAIPSVSKENQGLVLVLFVIFFIIGVPCYPPTLFNVYLGG